MRVKMAIVLATYPWRRSRRRRTRPNQQLRFIEHPSHQTSNKVSYRYAWHVTVSTAVQEQYVSHLRHPRVLEPGGQDGYD